MKEEIVEDGLCAGSVRLGEAVAKHRTPDLGLNELVKEFLHLRVSQSLEGVKLTVNLGR